MAYREGGRAEKRRKVEAEEVRSAKEDFHTENGETDATDYTCEARCRLKLRTGGLASALHRN